jgi:hypothetical protein
MADESILWEQPECGAKLIFHFPPGYSLWLDVLPWQHELTLSYPDCGPPRTIGIMDPHQMSDLFRWEEFLAITQCLARRAEPAWADELLLSPYVAVTEDCAGSYLTRLRWCLSESRLFTESEAEHVVAYARAIVRRDFRWIEDPALGWVAEGEDAYSLRQAGGDFDFAAFRGFLRAVGIPG